MIDSKYLRFDQAQVGDNRKTEVWNVYSKSSGGMLGQIKWFGQWRQYCFWPFRDRIFNTECMSDISKVIKELMGQRGK